MVLDRGFHIAQSVASIE